MQESPDAVEKECALFQVLSTLIRQHGERTLKGGERHALRADIRQAIDYLHSDYHQPLAVSEIAAVAGLSEYHFMRTFQKLTGLSVHQYLTQIRLMRAKRLLSQGFDAAHTASEVGFFDQSHFIQEIRAILALHRVHLRRHRDGRGSYDRSCLMNRRRRCRSVSSC
ncbi:AraC family transcriptional regulator (plasmid) [Pseudomonas silvicola]|nr:AraC family transcriptional regulator [Pseudomonas silvicola]